MNILSFQFEDFFQHFLWGETSGDELPQVCFVWESFVSPSFLKDNFSGSSPLGWQFSPPSTLSMSMDGGQIAVGGRRTDEAPAFHPWRWRPPIMWVVYK